MTKNGFLATSLVFVYLSVLWVFDYVNFYETNFETSGAKVVFYNISRLLIVAGLGWVIFCLGSYITSLVSKFGNPRHKHNIFSLDSVIASSFAGYFIAQLICYVAGIFGLLAKEIVLIGYSIICLATIPRVRQCITFTSLVNWKQSENKYVVTFLCALILLVTLVRGLYPLGGHDVYTHYFDYYSDVINTGSLGPHSAWQHFFYSKGLTVFFLASHLSDLLAPGLVTSMLFALGALTMFNILRCAGAQVSITFFGVILFALFFVIGVDEFEKQHPTVAILILGMVWALMKMDLSSQRSPVVVVALFATSTSIILITLQTFFLLAMFFGGVAAVMLLSRNWASARVCFSLVVCNFITVITICAIDYHLAGMPHEQFIVATWDYFDLNKLKALAMLGPVIDMHYTFKLISAGNPSDIPFLSFEHFKLIWKYLRLNLWWPLAIPLPFLLIVSWVAFKIRVISYACLRKIFIPFWFLICLIAVGVVAGTAQHFSIYRLMSMAYAITLIVILFVWSDLFRQSSRDKNFTAQTLSFVSLLFSLVIFVPVMIKSSDRPEYRWNIQYRGNNGIGLNTILENSSAFLSGKYSIKDAYQNQLGWEAKHPTGGLFPPMYEAYKVVGKGTTIVSFHLHDYCMAPSCKVYRPVSQTLGKNWQTRYEYEQGSAQSAKKSLLAENIDYFFISFELPIWAKRHNKELFTPSNMKRELGVIWHDDNSYLLTWKNDSTAELSDAFLDRFSEVYWGKSPAGPAGPTYSPTYLKLLDMEKDMKPFQLPW